MARSVNIQQLIKIVEQAIPALIAEKDEYEIPTLKTLEGLVRRRVFTKGQDTAGRTRRYKSAKYSKSRKKSDGTGKKVQAGLVNLVDTGDLQRDFGVYIDAKKDNSLGFINANTTVRSGKKAYTFLKPSTTKVEAEEKRRGDNPIFIPQQKELERAFKVFTEELGRVYKRIIEKKLNV